MAVALFGEEGFHDVLPPLVDAVRDGAFQLDYRVFGFGNVHDRQTKFGCSLFVSAIIRCRPDSCRTKKEGKGEGIFKN